MIWYDTWYDIKLYYFLRIFTEIKIFSSLDEITICNENIYIKK